MNTIELTMPARWQDAFGGQLRDLPADMRVLVYRDLCTLRGTPRIRRLKAWVHGLVRQWPAPRHGVPGTATSQAQPC